MMVEHGYNFKQGTMLMYFPSAAHKPNSCNGTLLGRALSKQVHSAYH